MSHPIQFSELVHRIIATALNVSKEFQHHRIETIHLLISLLQCEKGLGRAVGYRALENLANPQEILAIATELAERLRKNPKNHKRHPSRLSKRVYRLAHNEAFSLGHRVVGSGHLLLGLFLEEYGLARIALMRRGITEENLRAEIKRQLDSELLRRQALGAGS